MKKIASHLVLLPLLFSSAQLSANDFEASLSSETAQFSLYSDSSVIGWGGSDLALRFLYNEDSDFLAQAEVLSMRQASEETPMTLGVGVKAYLGSLDDVDEDVVAIGIGGSIRYVIPGTMPITLYGSAFIAPKITSFAGSEELKDVNFGVQVEAMPQTTMFVGYRRLAVDTDNVSNYRVDDGHLHFGIRLKF